MAGADRGTGRKILHGGRREVIALAPWTCQRIERDSSNSVCAFCNTWGPFINSLKTAVLNAAVGVNF